MKILKEIDGVFVEPKRKYYCGNIIYGTPYFNPRNFNSTLVSFRKEKRKYERNYNFKIFGIAISIGWPIYIYWHELGWKDKWNTPRFEWCPAFYIYFFKWQFRLIWTSPDDNVDGYWEQVLWWLKYSEKDIVKAKETWGWTNKGVSTWNDDYIIKPNK